LFSNTRLPFFLGTQQYIASHGQGRQRTGAFPPCCFIRGSTGASVPFHNGK